MTQSLILKCLQTLILYEVEEADNQRSINEKQPLVQQNIMLRK